MKVKLLVVAAVLCFAVVVRGDDVKEEQKKMDGTWVPVMAELSGQKLSDDFLKTTRLILAGDKYTTKVGEVTDQGTTKIDSAAKPKALDITGTDGPNKGKTFLAIYELKDDTLKVCYDLSGKARPTEFQTKKDTQLFLVTYQRAKP